MNYAITRYIVLYIKGILSFTYRVMLTVRFLSEINQPFTTHSTLHDMSTLHKKLYLVTADVTENPFYF